MRKPGFIVVSILFALFAGYKLYDEHRTFDLGSYSTIGDEFYYYYTDSGGEPTNCVKSLSADTNTNGDTVYNYTYCEPFHNNDPTYIPYALDSEYHKINSATVDQDGDHGSLTVPADEQMEYMAIVYTDAGSREYGLLAVYKI